MTHDPEYARQMAFAVERARRAKGHLSHVRWKDGHLDVTIEPNGKPEQVAAVEQPSRRGIRQGLLF